MQSCDLLVSYIAMILQGRCGACADGDLALLSDRVFAQLGVGMAGRHKHLIKLRTSEYLTAWQPALKVAQEVPSCDACASKGMCCSCARKGVCSVACTAMHLLANCLNRDKVCRYIACAASWGGASGPGKCHTKERQHACCCSLHGVQNLAKFCAASGNR